MATTMAGNISSPMKRKRAAPVPDFDEGWDAASLQVESVPSRKKKARVHLEDAHFDNADAASDYAASSVPSLSDTNTATVTVADTHTPATDASTTRSKPREKKYHCTFPDCNKAFDRPVRLQTHINSHTGNRPHACPKDDCDKSFYKPEHLSRHMKEKHGDSTFVCTFKVHKDDTGKIEPCGKVFESATKLKRHVAVHEDKDETTCTWEGCGKVFRKQETLQRHIKKDHLNEDSYICTRELPEGGGCGQAFPTPGQLRGHHARDHDLPKYVCDICTNAMAISPEDLVQDEDLDPAFLPTADDLAVPTEEVDSNILSSLSLEDAAPAGLQYLGGVVGFATYHELQRHNKVEHPPICSHCGKKCKSSKDLTAHIDIQHPPGGVPLMDAPQPEKKYLCPYEDCARSQPGNGFAKKGNMDVHIKSAHTKQKDFTCGTFDLGGVKKVEGWNGQGCGLALATKQALIGHVRTQHLGLPAALGARTGLMDKDRKRASKSKMKSDPDMDEEEMDLDAVPEVAPPNQALAMITGGGYEELRPVACMLAGGPRGCQMRFVNDYDMCAHMELSHKWNVDDINDALFSGKLATPGAQEGLSEDTLREMLTQEMNAIDPQLQGLAA